jgi:hypothetical protein
LRGWYDAHPDATFGQIEEKARELRHTFMGQALAIVINGRDAGFQMEAPRCSQCGAQMEFTDYRDWLIHGLEGETTLERAYYVCPKCKGETLFPLDHKLQLRHDHWSEGAARVAARQGFQAASFEEAAESYRQAVGGVISGSTVRRITEEMGCHVDALHTQEAEKASAPAQKGESPRTRRIEEHNPVHGQGNISSDGAMILIRGEGWKEIKGAAISQVEVLPPAPRRKGEKHRRDEEPIVKLTQHSYVAGLWDADEFAKFQYAEGLRRGLEGVKKLSSVNDGSLWIERVTATNFPHAVQIVDWSHADERIWTVAQAVLGDGSAQAASWAESRLDELWQGQIEAVVQAMLPLDPERFQSPDIIRQSPGYFEANKERMRYDRFRAEHYPIGSGTMESAAKNVVHRRMRRPGRGWKRENANPMLAGVCELRSGRFEYAWQRVSHLSAKSHLQL